MNVLILTAKYGMGHYTASMALKQELESESVQVEVVDFFDIIFPKIKTVIYGLFDFLVSRCCNIYNFFYRFSANSNFAPFNKIIRRRIDNLIEESKASIIISTFPVCTKYISTYKKKNNKDLKLYTYITDIEANKEWISDEIDTYFVASDETKMQIVENNISEEKIRVVGIPVRKEFKNEMCVKDKNEIVVMGGGLGLIPDMKLTLESLVQNKDIHITLLAGKNEKLLEQYNNKYDNMTVVGYTNEVYKYMKKAELVITKAGGITLFEAIYSKTPIYILPPFLSQEIGNAKFIMKNEIGVVVWNKNENVANDIIQLLKEPEKLESMRNNMQKVKEKLEKSTVVDVYGEEIMAQC